MTANEVKCASAAVTSSRVDAGPGDDVVTISTTANRVTVNGGAGNDRINDGNGSDFLSGDDGNDTIVGKGGADALIGGAGDDTLNGGLGADTFLGGDGVDTVTYADRGSVTVSIDDESDSGNSNDGPVGQRDDVFTDVENLVGGSSADTLIGSELANRITGGGGADRLVGLGGNDTLVAKDGVADTQIDCDGGDPAGTADQASIDAVDPAPANCETVTR